MTSIAAVQKHQIDAQHKETSARWPSWPEVDTALAHKTCLGTSATTPTGKTGGYSGVSQPIRDLINPGVKVTVFH